MDGMIGSRAHWNSNGEILGGYWRVEVQSVFAGVVEGVGYGKRTVAGICSFAVVYPGCRLDL